MRSIKVIVKWLIRSGLWPLRYIKFVLVFFAFKRSVDERFRVDWLDRFACLNDATTTTGFDRHYVYHPAWAMRRILSVGPSKHIDISSTLHFCSMLSACLPVEFYDYRPAGLILENLKDERADLASLPFEDQSVASISCMHVVEHIGLGRYGDALDAEGDLKAIMELKRVLDTNGDLYFVVPIGAVARVQFNAHRIYRHEQVVEMFADLQLIDFSVIPDDPRDGGLVSRPDNELLNRQSYACGCYHFRKSA